MKRHLAYLRYVMLHKWYVFLACRGMNVPIWLAIFHDVSKFTITEWGSYARQFYNDDGTPIQRRDASGAYDPNAQSMEFKRAWANHQKNKHHWQAWVSIGSEGSLEPLPMPEVYVREMVADWIGAGRVHGKTDLYEWYAKNKINMVLHAETERLISWALLQAEAQLYTL